MRSPSTTTAFHKVAEKVVEDVSEAREIEAARGPTTSAHTLIEGLMPEMVVGGPFLGILQDFVGLAYLLESGFCLGISGVPVRMILHRELAIGGFDRLIVGATLDA